MQEVIIDVTDETYEVSWFSLRALMMEKYVVNAMVAAHTVSIFKLGTNDQTFI